jgi:hypothetical protein
LTDAESRLLVIADFLTGQPTSRFASPLSSRSSTNGLLACTAP